MSNDIYIFSIGGTILLLVLIFFIINFVTVLKKKQVKLLKEKAILQDKFHKEILTAQIEIQEQTLRNVSQEIHDNIGQVLSLVKLNLNTLSGSFDDDAKLKMRDTKELISKAIFDLRLLARNLQGHRIEEVGFYDSVKALATLIKNSGICAVHFSISGELCQINEQKGIIIYRMIQEALNNAVKYADARDISIELINAEEKLAINITDNGNGFDIDKARADDGLGLKSMHKRAQLLSADWDIITSPGGTTVKIAIPKKYILA